MKRKESPPLQRGEYVNCEHHTIEHKIMIQYPNSTFLNSMISAEVVVTLTSIANQSINEEFVIEIPSDRMWDAEQIAIQYVLEHYIDVVFHEGMGVLIIDFDSPLSPLFQHCDVIPLDGLALHGWYEMSNFTQLRVASDLAGELLVKKYLNITYLLREKGDRNNVHPTQIR